jgi:hypothetical protein
LYGVITGIGLIIEGTVALIAAGVGLILSIMLLNGSKQVNIALITYEYFEIVRNQL